LKLLYHWTDCPRCRCHVAVNFAVYQDRLKGSCRRWSSDYRINDGTLIDVSREQIIPNGSGSLHFAVTCRCGQTIDVPVQRGELAEGGMVLEKR
jgi:hypothetical protein